jgi:hypothetical protein
MRGSGKYHLLASPLKCSLLRVSIETGKRYDKERKQPGEREENVTLHTAERLLTTVLSRTVLSPSAWLAK